MLETEPAPQRRSLRFCKAFFEVLSFDKTRQRLLAARALEILGPASDRGDAEYWYRWDEPDGDRAHVPVSYLIRLTARRLVLEGPSPAAIGRGWRALDEQLRPYARARVAAGDDLARFLPRQRRHSADRPESWSREHENKVLAEFYAAFCKRWAHQPHPLLGGRTPLEASGDPSLRNCLEQVLRRMERLEEQRRARRMPGFSVADLRRTVGVRPGTAP